MKLRNLIIGFLLIGIFVNIGVVFGGEYTASNDIGTGNIWAIKITNNANKDLTNYQVKIELNNANFDFNTYPNPPNGLKFFNDKSLTVELPYWIEYWNASEGKAIIWVKTNLAANSNKTIYMIIDNSIRGNPNIENNGDAVFEFFDDFNGNSLNTSKWGILGSPSYQVSNGKLEISYSESWNVIYSKYVLPTNYVIETKYNCNKGDHDTRIGINLNISDTNYVQCLLPWEGGDSRIDKILDGWFSGDHYKTGLPYLYGPNQVVELKITNNTIKSITINGNTILTDLKVDRFGNYFGLMKDSDDKVYFDYIFVRKYVDTEPTIEIKKEVIQPIKTESLHIESNPSRANVYVDGHYEGITPLKISKITPGTHTITIIKEGYKDYTKEIEILPGETKSIIVNLEPTITINMAILLIGLIVVGGGIYLIGKRKQNKIDKIDKSEKITTKEETTNEVLVSTISDFPKELLNKYIPLEKLGEGGFGKVFKVKRKSDGKIIALKVPNVDEKAKKYILKEIKAWQNLNHPNIVKIYNAYEEPIPHIEMEYVDGYNLNGKLIRDLDKYPKPVNPKDAIKLIKQIAEGLKHAHNKNIIHRDIKPSNILLTSNLIPKITDWGLAKVGAKSSTATTTKALTLLYSAPEQIDEEVYGKTDKRTDIYQLGVLFYELLTGKLPYEGSSPAQISLKIANPEKKPLPPSKIKPELSIFDGLFEKLLAKKKEDRFQSIDEFLEALHSLEELNKEKEKLKKTLTKTTELIKKSTDKKEIEKLTRELIDLTIKLALNCAKANDKVGLLDALESLKDYVKSEENKKELNNAINHIEYLIKEQIPLEKNTIERLEVLLNRIKKEWK